MATTVKELRAKAAEALDAWDREWSREKLWEIMVQYLNGLRPLENLLPPDSDED